MTDQTGDAVFSDPNVRRELEEELLIGNVADTVDALLKGLSLTQHELAQRLGVTDGRVSQILSGTENLRLRTLGALGWALGVRFALRPEPMMDRTATPAVGDGPLPAWIRSDDQDLRLSRDDAMLSIECEPDRPTGDLPRSGGDFVVAA